jgi:hypothetical protein
MSFCHLEDCPPWVPVDSSLGLGHPEEDTGCAGGLVRRPCRRCPDGRPFQGSGSVAMRTEAAKKQGR